MRGIFGQTGDSEGAQFVNTSIYTVVPLRDMEKS